MEADDRAIDVRLNNIENTLTELKGLLLESKLQARDITEIRNSLKQTNEVMESYADRSQSSISKLESRVLNLEQKPYKDKAARWSGIVDVLYKSVVTIAVGYILAKVGLE